jgi:predicted nucleic acid-binding protein
MPAICVTRVTNNERHRPKVRLPNSSLSIHQPVSRDPDDDHVLACALAAQADLIVSGDRDLLTLREYQGMPILSTAGAMARIAESG